MAANAEVIAWARRWAADRLSEAATMEAVRTVDAPILQRIPELAADPMLVEDLHGSTRHQWQAFLSTLGQPEHRLMLPEQAVDLARSIARRGLDMAVLLKVYRVCHDGLYEYFTEVVAALGPDDPPREEVMKFLWRRLDQWLDDSIERLIAAFDGERQQMHDTAVSRRAAMIARVLEGDAVSVDQASDVLRHPLLQWQTGFVIWGEAAGAGITDGLRAIADDLGRALAGSPPLIHAAGSRDLWCWVATPALPDVDALRGLEGAVAGRGIRVTVGLPERGVDGFRSSHEDARAAQRLCLEAAGTEPIVAYRDVELLCLTRDSGDLLRRMVAREVGALRGRDRNLAQVRDTVLAYLDNRMNVEATAATLFVHRNTVRYRLQRAEELIGHPLTERVAQVEIGLRYLALRASADGDD